jgi:tetratricopeptide (TPR) repeat protein
MEDQTDFLKLARTLATAGDHTGAAAALSKAKELARAKGDLESVAAILTTERQEYWEAGNVAEAERVLKEEVDVSRQVGNTRQLANALMGLAFFPNYGTREERRHLLNEAQNIASRYGYTDIQQQIGSRRAMYGSAGLEFP